MLMDKEYASQGGLKPASYMDDERVQPPSPAPAISHAIFLGKPPGHIKADLSPD
jgi:hypothetical protein